MNERVSGINAQGGTEEGCGGGGGREGGRGRRGLPTGPRHLAGSLAELPAPGGPELGGVAPGLHKPLTDSTQRPEFTRKEPPLWVAPTFASGESVLP